MQMHRCIKPFETFASMQVQYAFIVPYKLVLHIFCAFVKIYGCRISTFHLALSTFGVVAASNLNEQIDQKA